MVEARNLSLTLGSCSCTNHASIHAQKHVAQWVADCCSQGDRQSFIVFGRALQPSQDGVDRYKHCIGL